MAEKTLSVFGDEGAGKKTLIGSLIYKVMHLTYKALLSLQLISASAD